MSLDCCLLKHFLGDGQGFCSRGDLAISVLSCNCVHCFLLVNVAQPMKFGSGVSYGATRWLSGQVCSIAWEFGSQTVASIEGM